MLQQGKCAINNDEIVELIKNSSIYPIGKVFRVKNEIPADVTEEEKESQITELVEVSLSGMDSKSRRVEILSNHDLFRLLQGNPTSISRAANIYMNKFTDVETL